MIGSKFDPIPFELAAEFAVIVDRAIEDDDQIAVTCRHGLSALRDVDDRQTLESESGLLARDVPFPDTMVVWSAVSEKRDRFPDGRGVGATDYGEEAAHREDIATNASPLLLAASPIQRAFSS